MKNARAKAAAILQRVVFNQQPLGTALDFEHKEINPPDLALIKAFCYGTLRHYYQLRGIASVLLKKPLASQDETVLLLLLLGLYQLEYMRIPNHAAVSETVAACRLLKKGWAAKLLNGCLRQFLRDRDALCKPLKRDKEAHYNHPHWLILQYQKNWPNDWKALLQANDLHPPLTLRINQQKTTRLDYTRALEEKNIPYQVVENCPTAVIINHPMPTSKIPGFLEGQISVQDSAAQFAATLLDVKKNQRVLDACAAPGGKTCHLLEMQPTLKQLIAIDADASRLEKIQENLNRLSLTTQLLCADASHLESWWDKQPFDRILLDVPCSSTGVIRRHPDIKLLRQPQDTEKLVQQQRLLLSSLWKTLKPGGYLLYVTCSVLPAENQDNIQWFLQSHPDAKLMALFDQPPEAIGYQMLPGENQGDGFYYAKLTKQG